MLPHRTFDEKKGKTLKPIFSSFIAKTFKARFYSIMVRYFNINLVNI